MPKSPETIEPPRKFTYLLQLYNTMLLEAEGIDGEVIYEGKVVETFASLNISMSYYTPLFNALKELGCIELLDRGVRGRLTRYRLHHAPTVAAYETRYGSDLTGTDRPATISLSELEQRIKNMERRLEGLEIKQVVLNFESRLLALEKLQPEGGSK